MYGEFMDLGASFVGQNDSVSMVSFAIGLMGMDGTGNHGHAPSAWNSCCLDCFYVLKGSNGENKI